MVRPHKYAYDGIIVYYMVKKQIEYSYDTNIEKFSKDPTFNQGFMWDIKYEPLHQIPTRLYEEIDRIRKKKKWPMMSWATLIKYLGDMVKEHILLEYPRPDKRNNETYYRLSEYTLWCYLKELDNRQRFLHHGSIGRRPYAALLITKLRLEVERIMYNQFLRTGGGPYVKRTRRKKTPRKGLRS
jgi:hypothetical protein